MTQLTSDQLNQLKKEFCIRVTDNMDLETLLEIAFDQLMNSFDNLDQEDMKDEVINYYNEDTTEYDKIVNTVTNSPYSSYGDYVTTNPEALTDYGVGK